MGYKIIGFAVVKGAKWYLRRRFGLLASRRVAAAGIVAAAVAAVLVARGRHTG